MGKHWLPPTLDIASQKFYLNTSSRHRIGNIHRRRSEFSFQNSSSQILTIHSPSQRAPTTNWRLNFSSNRMTNIRGCCFSSWLDLGWFKVEDWSTANKQSSSGFCLTWTRVSTCFRPPRTCLSKTPTTTSAHLVYRPVARLPRPRLATIHSSCRMQMLPTRTLLKFHRHLLSLWAGRCRATSPPPQSLTPSDILRCWPFRRHAPYRRRSRWTFATPPAISSRCPARRLRPWSPIISAGTSSLKAYGMDMTFPGEPARSTNGTTAFHPIAFQTLWGISRSTRQTHLLLQTQLSKVFKFLRITNLIQIY